VHSFAQELLVQQNCLQMQLDERLGPSILPGRPRLRCGSEVNVRTN
jgi:hypothetical protein